MLPVMGKFQNNIEFMQVCKISYPTVCFSIRHSFITHSTWLEWVVDNRSTAFEEQAAVLFPYKLGGASLMLRFYMKSKYDLE